MFFAVGTHGEHHHVLTRRYYVHSTYQLFKRIIVDISGIYPAHTFTVVHGIVHSRDYVCACICVNPQSINLLDVECAGEYPTLSRGTIITRRMLSIMGKWE